MTDTEGMDGSGCARSAHGPSPAGPRSATRGDPLGLTRREREVLAEICAGQTNAAIAAKLFQNAMKPRFHGVLTPWNPGSSASGGANETTEIAESL